MTIALSRLTLQSHTDSQNPILSPSLDHRLARSLSILLSLLLPFCLTKCKISQRLTIHSQSHPIVHLHRTQAPIKLQAGLIPLQTAPLQPPTINLEHLLRERLQKTLAPTSVAVLRSHEEVFEVNSRLATPGRVVVEVEGHAGYGAGLVVGPSVRGGGVGGCAEDEGFGVAWIRVLGGCAGGEGEGAFEGVFGCEDFVGLFLVVRKFLDKGEDFGDVCCGRVSVMFIRALAWRLDAGRSSIPSTVAGIIVGLS